MLRSAAFQALFLLPACLFGAALPDAALLVDRGLSPESSLRALRVGWTAADVYVADHFVLGQPGEMWVIDKVRVWAVPGLENGQPGALGDLFEKITLFGGLESENPPTTASQAALVCACHGPIPIASTSVSPGSSASQDSHVLIQPIRSAEGASFNESGRSLSVWQMDFEDLRWNVPGGVNVQFGVHGAGRPGSNGKHVWFNLASNVSGEHDFRLFETNGSPVVPAEGTVSSDHSVGINVQVWGHRTARVDVRRLGNTWQVKLLDSPGIDVHQVRVETLHFGPKGAKPVESTVEPSSDEGGAELVLKIAAAAAGIQPNQLTACLGGRLLDNVPFEGCAAVTWR